MAKTLYFSGDGRRHGPLPGTTYKTAREKRCAPRADLRSRTGRRYRQLVKLYTSRMPHSPDPLEKDQVIQAVLFRLKMDECEIEQLKTGQMPSAYIPLCNAHASLLRVLRVTDQYGTPSPKDTPVSPTEARAVRLNIEQVRAALEIPTPDDDDDDEVETPIAHEATQ